MNVWQQFLLYHRGSGMRWIIDQVLKLFGKGRQVELMQYMRHLNK
jgi:hypothetical protein